jgi:hypothetical protein
MAVSTAYPSRASIEGEQVDAASGETFDSLSPRTGEVIAASAPAGPRTSASTPACFGPRRVIVDPQSLLRAWELGALVNVEDAWGATSPSPRSVTSPPAPTRGP